MFTNTSFTAGPAKKFVNKCREVLTKQQTTASYREKRSAELIGQKKIDFVFLLEPHDAISTYTIITKHVLKVDSVCIGAHCIDMKENMTSLLYFAY